MGGAPLWVLSAPVLKTVKTFPLTIEFPEIDNVIAAHAETSYYDNPAHHHS